MYFGDIGKNSETLVNYFERNGAMPCGENENPAEWMLRVIGASPGAKIDRDWGKTWQNSDEFSAVRKQLAALEIQGSTDIEPKFEDGLVEKEYAAPAHYQFLICTKRLFEQYWRTPSYIYSKFILCGGTVSLPPYPQNLVLILPRASSSASHSTRPNSPCKAFKLRCFQFSCCWSLLRS